MQTLKLYAKYLTMLGILSLLFTASASAAPPRPVNPVLGTDQNNPTTVNSTQKYEFTDPRPYFNVDVRTMDDGTPFTSQPNEQRSGPDEVGLYHFTFVVEAAPVNRTLKINVAGSDASGGFCSGSPSECEFTDYYVRATGPPPQSFREIALSSRQQGCQVGSSYSFIANEPAELVHQVVLYSQIGRQSRRVVLRRLSPRQQVFSAVFSSRRQTRTIRPVDICTPFMRRKLKSLQQKGARLSFEATAYLLSKGQKFGVKKQKRKLVRK